MRFESHLGHSVSSGQAEPGLSTANITTRIEPVATMVRNHPFAEGVPARRGLRHGRRHITPCKGREPSDLSNPQFFPYAVTVAPDPGSAPFFGAVLQGGAPHIEGAQTLHAIRDAIRSVEEAAARNTRPDFEHEHAAPELQTAVAWAVTQGMPIRDVANAAQMTALEVLDAADSLSFRTANSGPPERGEPDTG